VIVCKADGTPTGLAFHGVPSGHEFTSFVLGLYNAAGPGQALDETTRQQIAAITNKTDMKILVTLSCTMCPDLVVAVQRIAVENPNVTAHVYDIRHFEHLQNQYKVMSVPCMVVNNKDVFFGKKNILQILDLIYKR
jgi:thioredoxin reductase (NADPH)